MPSGPGKSYQPQFGEPWTLAGPDEDAPCWRLIDRGGVERLRTPGTSEGDRRYAERTLDAVNAMVNLSPVVLANLAEKWNRNALRHKEPGTS